MPVAKGQPYGEPAGQLPEGAVLVRSDGQARSALEEARRRRRSFPVLGLLGGDLCRTLGGGSGGPQAAERRLRAGEGVRFTVDVGEALLDGKLCLFVAHLVARSRLWRRSFVAMNAQYMTVRGGRWNLGPRAHPGDGLLDTYEAHLALGQLWAVRRRLHHGAHLPHPGIAERRAGAVSVDLERPLPVWLDGLPVGKARSLSVRADPDAVVMVVG